MGIVGGETALLLGALSTVLLATSQVQAQDGVPAPHGGRTDGGARTHDGLLLELRLGAGLGVMDSNASASNGFREPNPQSASGGVLPLYGAAAGGTFGSGLVLGGWAGHAELRGPVFETEDGSFRVPELRLSAITYGVFARYYPDPHEGLQFGGGIAYAYVQTRRSPDQLIAGGRDVDGGRTLHGAAVFLEAGHGIWLANQWSLNGAVRFDVGHVENRDGPQATYLVSTVSAMITYH